MVTDMAYIPGGWFIMGSDDCGDTPYDEEGPPSEKPEHIVYLDSYFIDIYEVTNGEYKVCVDAGVCTPPVNEQYATPCATAEQRYNDPARANHPVMCVYWEQAMDYCTWAGKRLPTEAEWEKAARGSADERIYPWGDGLDEECIKANVYYPPPSSPCPGDTTEVGTHPDGASPYGVMDMAGNVEEWVNDWYAADYYSISPSINPTGPASGTEKVFRGGSYQSPSVHMRVSRRVGKCDYGSDLYLYNISIVDPTVVRPFIGIRCASSP